MLDTNVLSELRRPKPNARVTEFVARQPLDLLYVSVVTFAEIRFGIELVRDVGRRRDLSDWLEHKLRPMFEGRVLEISEAAMAAAGGGRAEERPHLRATRFDHRGDGSASRIDDCVSRYERL